MKVLVINSGSSSLKAQLIETESGESFVNMYCEKIGLDDSFMTYKKEEKIKIQHAMPTHEEALQLVLDTLVDKDLGVIKSLDEIGAIGHRVVNMGEKYNKSMVVTKDIYEDMKNYIQFAPLHNPAAMLGIQACFDLLPNKKNVAVFDTAFHSTMPEKAFVYAIPYEFYEENKIRRYGAHGTSHKYIALKMKELIGDLNGKKIISCHIGGGASVCAIKDGKCVDTSMGLTPLAGVVMGTRSGDIDPSIVKNIMDIKGINIDEAINLLNKKSGLLGITGEYSDMRDIESNLDKPRVKLAFDVMNYSIKKYIGAYAAALNGVDAIAFTAGIGEKDELVREAVCKDMEYLGIELDYEKNIKLNKPSEPVLISKPNSRVKVYIVPTDEEYMIAMDTANLVK